MDASGSVPRASCLAPPHPLRVPDVKVRRPHRTSSQWQWSEHHFAVADVDVRENVGIRDWLPRHRRNRCTERKQNLTSTPSPALRTSSPWPPTP